MTDNIEADPKVLPDLREDEKRVIMYKIKYNRVVGGVSVIKEKTINAESVIYMPGLTTFWKQGQLIDVLHPGDLVQIIGE
jgi:hypothetical protein